MAILEPGASFPILTLRDESGSAVSPSSRETLYAVFKTTCPTCELAWPYLERIRQAAAGGALEILAISQDDPETTSAFNTRLGIRVKTVYDPEPWTASDSLGITSVPTFIRVGPDSSVDQIVVGFDREQMEEFARRAASLARRPNSGLFRTGEDVPAIRPG